jgi:hypothetical protein
VAQERVRARALEPLSQLALEKGPALYRWASVERWDRLLAMGAAEVLVKHQR